MTNYEYITSMNVNDLASLLSCVYKDWEESTITIDGCCLFDSIGDVAEWLKKEHNDSQ
nr:MAG TPA: hypothetical protein [Caudoviricetes sp.]